MQIAAFGGGLIAFVVYALARYEGRTETVTLILTGVAVAAIAAAGVGFLIARADDDQLRDIVFWSLGSLGGATWTLVAVDASVRRARCPRVHRASTGRSTCWRSASVRPATSGSTRSANALS